MLANSRGLSRWASYLPSGLWEHKGAGVTGGGCRGLGWQLRSLHGLRHWDRKWPCAGGANGSLWTRQALREAWELGPQMSYERWRCS